MPVPKAARLGGRLLLVAMGVYVAAWHIAFTVVVLGPALGLDLSVAQLWELYTTALYTLWSPAHAELAVATQSLTLALTGITLVCLGIIWFVRARRRVAPVS